MRSDGRFFLRIDHATLVWLGAAATILALMVAWELAAPRRPLTVPRTTRWPANFAIAAINNILLRVALPGGAAGFALWCAARHWGLLRQLALPPWIAVPLALIMLDLVIYLEHVVFHRLPLLWRIHRMHHTDRDFDFSTGIRFHPFEIGVSMLVKLTAVLALGVPAASVVAFEAILTGSSIFTHGNATLGARADRLVRKVFVTPDMHRVHHSNAAAETNSNFGFNLSCWDYLFGTYRAAPAAGHRRMTIGLADFPGARELRLGGMLRQPWSKPERQAGRG